jgi:hypothetical protein
MRIHAIWNLALTAACGAHLQSAPAGVRAYKIARKTQKPRFAVDEGAVSACEDLSGNSA